MVDETTTTTTDTTEDKPKSTPPTKTIYNTKDPIKHFDAVDALIAEMRTQTKDGKDTEVIKSVVFVLNSAKKAFNELYKPVSYTK